MTMSKFSVLISVIVLVSVYNVYPRQSPDELILLNIQKLKQAKMLYGSGDYKKSPAIKKVIKEADKALSRENYSIIDKTQIPPSGDKHDYCTLARYWWPNPNTPDSLPYIRRDGEVNPEIFTSSDLENVQRLCSEALPLSVAYYITGDEKYAEKEVATLRRWFVDTTTRMNPNFNYSQMVKGSLKENYSGIIDGNQLPKVLDAVLLLSDSKAMTPEIKNGINKWFDSFLTWLLESSHGKRESKSKNNHGTWYDQDVAAIGLFLGKVDLVKKVCEEVKAKRIGIQIAIDGSQPIELERTRSLHYSCYNLEALSKLAKIAQRVNIDLWNYTTSDGSGIQKAFDYIIPSIAKEKDWPHKQIDAFKVTSFIEIFSMASDVYGDKKYVEAAEKSYDGNFSSVLDLLCY